MTIGRRIGRARKQKLYGGRSSSKTNARVKKIHADDLRGILYKRKRRSGAISKKPKSYTTSLEHMKSKLGSPHANKKAGQSFMTWTFVDTKTGDYIEFFGFARGRKKSTQWKVDTNNQEFANKFMKQRGMRD